MRSSLWRVAQWGLGLVIVVFVVRYVLANWQEVQRADLQWRLSPPMLLTGVALIWLIFAVLADAWRRMVAGWGRSLAWLVAARIWLLSSMAKYVPGKVWALAGLAVMSERNGVPAWAATASALVLQVLSLGTGALVVAVSGLTLLPGRSLPGTAALTLLAAGSLAGTALALWPPVTRRVVAAIAPSADLTHVPGLNPIVFGTLANVAAWIGYGVAFWLFARGTLPAAPLTIGESIGVFTASYVAGVIAPFAPGGLGVREGVMVLALRDRTGLATALALAAVARLGMTIAEVTAAVPFLLRPREAPRE